MDIKITPGLLAGKINAIPSKSHGHRLLISNTLAALCDLAGDSNVASALKSTETEKARAVIERSVNEIDTGHNSTDISATRECLLSLADQVPEMDCVESGSTLRFMMPVTMVLRERALLKGSPALLSRPISALKKTMEQNGCSIRITNNSLEINGAMKAGTYVLPGNISSQYITGLMLALPLLDSGSVIEVTTKLESSGYIGMTMGALREFGIEISKKSATKKKRLRYMIDGGQRYTSSCDLAVEGDWSNMAFWFTANALGSKIICGGVDLKSMQGDKAIIDIIARYENLGSPYDTGRPVTIDGADTPDLIPAAAVLATQIPRKTRIVHASRLRIKESNRLRSTCDMLLALGAEISETPDGLILKGVSTLHGGTVDGRNDHRIVMAAAIAATVCSSPVIIKGAEAVEKSYPDFFKDFVSLGGKAEVLK